jgi:ATP-dependent Clp protease ATP-binding subunit ClpC
MPGVPSALAEAIKELETMLDEKDAAIMRQEYELAAELRDRVVRLRDHIARLEANRARAQRNEQFYEA